MMSNQPLNSPRIIEAEEFRLVNASGRLRAIFHTWPGTGDPRLEFFDENGIGRLCLEVLHNEGEIRVLTQNGQPIVSIGVSDQGEIGMLLSRMTGMPGIRLAIAKNGEATIVLYDRHGNQATERPC